MRSKGTREEWRERVRAWQESGLSRAEFARQTRVHPATLTWWRWKLASENGERRRARPRRQSRRREAPIAFVEIGSQAESSLRSAGEDRIELEVAGVRLRVPQTFRSEALARILAVLEGRA